MILAPATAERVTFERLVWISACLALALLAHLGSLPAWVFATVAVIVAVRLVLAARARPAPGRAIRSILTALSVGVLFLQFHTFNGLSAGTALLCLVAGLKLLETQTRRDIYVVTMIIYFLSLAALLQGESFWLLGYLVAVSLLTTATLLRLTCTVSTAGWLGSLRYAGRMLAQALPLALAFWLFFPRFGAPLWQMPAEGGTAQTGLGESMSPGDITNLVQSDDVAFRVRFTGATPPLDERYWRGPVLHDFDGHTWTRGTAGMGGAAGMAHAVGLVPEGAAYRYTVSIEPHQRHWIFALDWPWSWETPGDLLTSDYMLVQPAPVASPVDVAVVSYARMHAAENLGTLMRRRDLRLPPARNPRTLALATELRRAHPVDADYVRAVLALFREQPFFYTLTPPKLADDSVDEFLFETRRGFCGHYASAFATLMRAGGIPARIVTGYQGGTFNRFADYWILRQSDAHAWTELWEDGRGWVRVDPTSAISPQRVERGLNDLVAANQPLSSRWQQRRLWLADTRLRLDALRQVWRERILRFDESSQERLLAVLHVPEPDARKLVFVLAACLALGLTWLTWSVRRELAPRPRDGLLRAYATLCRRLAAVGLPRAPHEPADTFAARVARERPDLGPAVTALCRRYSRLRYGAVVPREGPHRTAAGLTEFIADVRSFRPRKPVSPRGSRTPLRPPDFPASS